MTSKIELKLTTFLALGSTGLFNLKAIYLKSNILTKLNYYSNALKSVPGLYGLLSQWIWAQGALNSLNFPSATFTATSRCTSKSGPNRIAWTYSVLDVACIHSPCLQAWEFWYFL
jgi:hypothetical protein